MLYRLPGGDSAVVSGLEAPVQTLVETTGERSLDRGASAGHHAGRRTVDAWTRGYGTGQHSSNLR